MPSNKISNATSGSSPLVNNHTLAKNGLYQL